MPDISDVSYMDSTLDIVRNCHTLNRNITYIDYLVTQLYLMVANSDVDLQLHQTGNFVARLQYIARAHICSLLHIILLTIKITKSV